MGKVRASAFSVSIDGFGAGPNQDLQHPLGVGGGELMAWLFKTRMFQEMIGHEGGTSDIDDHFARKSMENLVHGSWGETCSALCEVSGPTIPGRAGGATIRRTTCRCSS